VFPVEEDQTVSSKKSSGGGKAIATVVKPQRAAAAEPEPAVTEPAQRSFEEIEADLKESQRAATPARRAAQERHEREVLGIAAGVTPESALRGISDLKVTIDATLEQLSQALVEQAKKFAAVQEAVALQTRHLAELYDIQVAADTLATLIREHGEKQHQLEAEAAARKAAVDREMQETRNAWDKERQRIQEELATEKARVKKEWQREQEEYDYNLKVQRKRDEEEYKRQRATLQAQLTAERVQQEKAFAEREAAVAAREQELADLRAKLQAAEAELQRAVTQAREEATGLAERRAQHEAALKAKDYEGTEKLLQQRIHGLEQLVADKNTRIEELQAELRDATVKVREIAVKAIEGAAGATALSRVSEIALQQAKGRDDRS
jgi:colicin import membrane protein